ncbi:hypothetical protein [Streptomyces sp. Isolate_45]|uniref:hypothetical protein n=1 Tax=Streptomyces sp. Isolate_45 TaxID=2950111 RepID=UPI0024820D6E|nr:hypothetical protein [Streptomyces sp. Isolate_45]MDA5279963.1 hypothetical protein [Streptomyces sp. Isolate_45]
MKNLLSDLARETAEILEFPAEPEALMQTLCSVMSEQMPEKMRKPIRLRIRAFPDSTGASGLTLEGDKFILVIVEQRTHPEHQLTILGHELWHVKNGDCGHHGIPVAAAARRFGTDDDIPWEELVRIAARSDSRADPNVKAEMKAEEFGLLVGSRFRSWLPGPRARDTITERTRAGRIASSLTARNGPMS